MTFLYDAGYSVVLLRPKNEVKLPTQSVEKWIYVGKWAAPSLADFFNHVVVFRFVPEFFSQRGRFSSFEKIMSLRYITEEGTGVKNSETRIKRSNVR